MSGVLMRRVVLISLALAACAASPPAPRAIVVAFMPREEVRWNCRRESHEPIVFGRIEACAVLTSSSCRIVAVEPRDDEDLEALATLGHELMHCVRGAAWHPRHVERAVP